jgi:hypothetical protein
MFSRFKNAVQKNSVEISDTGIEPSIKDHLVNMQGRFRNYIPAAVSDKCKWIVDQFHADSPQHYDFSLLKKKIILTLYLVLL